MLLSEQPILIVDCQTTGATPEKGELLDLAWALATGDSKPVVESALIQIEGELPPAITRLTGVLKDDLAEAIAVDEAQRRFIAALEERAGPVVAHWARFEKRFLAPFAGGAWPDEVICTHAIASRLLPELPRLGIRALSGYFGESMDEEKRAAGHVAATHRIWRELVAMLSERGVGDLEGLREWLATTRKPKRCAATRSFPLPRKRRLGLPEEPGVYRMLGRDEAVLYVGKATSLKARVNSYYRGRKGEGERKLELVTQVHELDVTPTETPFHAAILEQREIKRYEPPYNRQFRSRFRDIAFASPLDFSSIRRRPDPEHTVGPLPSATSLEGAQWLLDAMAGSVRPLQFVEVDSADIEAGLELFREEVDALALGVDWEPMTLRRVGAHFRLIEEDDDDDDDDDADVEESDEGRDRIWTAEDIADYARWVARGVDRTLRRAEAFRRFASGDLHWRSLVTEREHDVSWRRGRVVETTEVLADEFVYDLESYDEIAVILGELKRLVRTGAELELRVAGEVWQRDRLASYFAGSEADAGEGERPS